MKKVILPIVYFGVICVMVLSVILVLSGVKSYIVELPNYKYSVNDVFMSDVQNVVSTNNDSFSLPYMSNNVSVKRHFYDKNSSNESQESSIIYYRNTYIQNKGVDYTSNEVFDVSSICDGEVVSIEDSELYGTVVSVRHNDNLLITYSNLSNVLVSVGYIVSSGEIIATTSTSNFYICNA